MFQVVDMFSPVLCGFRRTWRSKITAMMLVSFIAAVKSFKEGDFANVRPKALTHIEAMDGNKNVKVDGVPAGWTNHQFKGPVKVLKVSDGSHNGAIKVEGTWVGWIQGNSLETLEKPVQVTMKRSPQLTQIRVGAASKAFSGLCNHKSAKNHRHNGKMYTKLNTATECYVELECCNEKGWIQKRFVDTLLPVTIRNSPRLLIKEGAKIPNKSDKWKSLSGTCHSLSSGDKPQPHHGIMLREEQSAGHVQLVCHVKLACCKKEGWIPRFYVIKEDDMAPTRRLLTSSKPESVAERLDRMSQTI